MASRWSGDFVRSSSYGGYSMLISGDLGLLGNRLESSLRGAFRGLLAALEATGHLYSKKHPQGSTGRTKGAERK